MLARWKIPGKCTQANNRVKYFVIQSCYSNDHTSYACIKTEHFYAQRSYVGTQGTYSGSPSQYSDNSSVHVWSPRMTECQSIHTACQNILRQPQNAESPPAHPLPRPPETTLRPSGTQSYPSNSKSQRSTLGKRGHNARSFQENPVSCHQRTVAHLPRAHSSPPGSQS